MTIRSLSLGALGTNCYIVWDEARHALIIDPAADADRILALVREESLQVAAVALTHTHFDHMLAADAVCKALAAPLWVGQKDVPGLRESTLNLAAYFCPEQAFSLTAQRLLAEGDVLEIGSLIFTALETPGHTAGSLCFYGEGVLFSGDTLFCGSMGRTDFPGGSSRDMMRSLARLSLLPDDVTVYPGHGAATSIGREKACNPYMSQEGY